MLNRTILVGRLVRDPELRTTNTGKNVAEFTVAVDKRIKPQGDGPTADFFRCKVWGQGADFIAQYGGKGRLASVDGRLETRKYTDKEGVNREIVEIVADNVSLLDKPAEGQGSPGAGSGQQPSGGYSEAPRSQGGAGGYQRPAAQPAKAPNADEYDPFADE